MDLINELVQQYVDDHTEAEPPVLKKINRDTYAKVMMPRMLSGHLQGRILSMLSHMINPNLILEIGTFTGYSAICMAEGMKPEGHLFTIDKNDELEVMVKKNFEMAGLSNRISYLIGNAIELVPKLEKTFDLVFIDADKKNYLNYYSMVFEKVSQGGYILVDNVLWSGKVVPDGRKSLDKDTKAIIDFNEYVHKDSRVQNVLLPIRDGLMILRKL